MTGTTIDAPPEIRAERSGPLVWRARRAYRGGLDETPLRITRMSVPHDQRKESTMLTSRRDVGQSSEHPRAACFAVICSRATSRRSTSIVPGSFRAQTDRWELPVRRA